MNARQTLWGFLVLVVASGALYGVDKSTRDSRNRSRCQSNLKQIGLALSIYMRDYDEKAVVATRWETDLKPYYFGRIETPLVCPADNAYAFNRHLSGIPFGWVDDWAKTPTVFDSTAKGHNISDFGASYAGKNAHILPRIGGGTNVLFLDGHVKWMQQKPIFRTLKPLAPPKTKKKTAKSRLLRGMTSAAR